jgi:molybdopterin converting factor small subunit
MELRVRYFASLVDLAGTGSETLTVEPGADVGDLWHEIGLRHPALRALGYRPMVACDMQYARWDTGLEGVREVAFLPPVSGG